MYQLTSKYKHIFKALIILAVITFISNIFNEHLQIINIALIHIIPKMFKEIHPVRKTPYKNTILLGVIVSVVAALTPISTLVHMCSFGTLFAFTMRADAQCFFTQ